jgi:hypothetical protein
VGPSIAFTPSATTLFKKLTTRLTEVSPSRLTLAKRDVSPSQKLNDYVAVIDIEQNHYNHTKKPESEAVFDCHPFLLSAMSTLDTKQNSDDCHDTERSYRETCGGGEDTS